MIAIIKKILGISKLERELLQITGTIPNPLNEIERLQEELAKAQNHIKLVRRTRDRYRTMFIESNRQRDYLRGRVAFFTRLFKRYHIEINL